MTDVTKKILALTDVTPDPSDVLIPEGFQTPDVPPSDTSEPHGLADPEYAEETDQAEGAEVLPEQTADGKKQKTFHSTDKKKYERKKKPEQPTEDLSKKLPGDNSLSIEPLRRDISALIKFGTLKTLKSADLDVITLKLCGLTNAEIAVKIGKSEPRIRNRLAKPQCSAAMAEATWNLKSGLLTASDVSMAVEADVMTRFAELALDVDTDLEWTYKFGSAVLNHRIKILQAVKGEVRSVEKTSEVIEISAEVRERMANRYSEAV
jgi:hypothetical protein